MEGGGVCKSVIAGGNAVRGSASAIIVALVDTFSTQEDESARHCQLRVDCNLARRFCLPQCLSLAIVRSPTHVRGFRILPGFNS
jgi:hypothetical protein